MIKFDKNRQHASSAYFFDMYPHRPRYLLFHNPSNDVSCIIPGVIEEMVLATNSADRCADMIRESDGITVEKFVKVILKTGSPYISVVTASFISKRYPNQYFHLLELLAERVILSNDMGYQRMFLDAVDICESALFRAIRESGLHDYMSLVQLKGMQR